jgi:zinc protease
LIVKRAGALGNVTIAYKGPDARDADLPPLTVLGAILGTGKNSRLSHALLDKSLVTKVEASVDPMHDPGPFIISATVAPNVTHQSVEDAVLAEIARIKQQGVSAEEVTRAVTQYRTDVAYNRDGTMSVVWSLNEWVAAGDWTLYIDFPNKIAKVTAADVQRVAKTYLDEDQSTTGWFIPVVTP